MNVISKHKAGFALGAFFGLGHVLWSALVVIGLAQPLLDLIFRLHFIRPPYTVGAFNLGTAVLLIVVTTAVGYGGGWVIAAIWNWVQQR